MSKASILLAYAQAGPFAAGACYAAAHQTYTAYLARAYGSCPRPAWRLCHGVVTGQGGAVRGVRYGHAWLEAGGWVFDATLGQFFAAGAYYKAGQIDRRSVVRYGPKAAVQAALDSGHYGPWAKGLLGPGVAHKKP